MTVAVAKKYELMGGQFYDLNPNWKGSDPHDPEKRILYRQGQVVTSTRSLDQVFPNKFREVVDQVIAPREVSVERRNYVQQILDQGPYSEDDRSFLEQMDDDGFGRIQRALLKSSAAETSKRMSSILGEDVTDQFQIAYDHQYKVFRHPSSGKFHVTKGSHNKPLNDSGLEKDKVDPFVTQHMKAK